jgi:hypothetical protein
MKLEEAIKKVREENLTKTQLEDYRNQMSSLLAEMQIEASDLEKDEALFMAGRANEESVIARKVEWKATPAGQRLIVVKRYISATKTLMTSLRDRLYNFY